MFTAFVTIVLAGIINGSFALFSKYFRSWKFEHIWLGFGIFAYLLVPIGFAWWLLPAGHNLISIDLSTKLGWLVMLGGIGFGIGQVCFVGAIHRIGMGLSFLLNIGIGTVLGFLLPLLIQYTDQVMTLAGLLTILASVLIVIGLILCNRAGKRRDHAESSQTTSHYFWGVVAASIAGLFSAGQNFTFSMTQSLQTAALQSGSSKLAASLVIWPSFLLFAFIPYTIYMLVLAARNRSYRNFVKPFRLQYLLFVILMGLFWYGSLVLYSYASQKIGAFGPVVGWPIFMVFIILMSNFWGWFKKEWQGCGQSILRQLLWGIILFVVAVVLLGISVSLRG